MGGAKFQFWAFTQFDMNWKFIPPNPDVRYICYQKEITPTTNRDHYQGYVEFYKQISKKKALLILNGGTMHIASRYVMATAEHNTTYCSKSETAYPDSFFQWGKLGGSQGSRTDLKQLKERILGGESVSDIALENPNVFHQYGRTLFFLEDIALSKLYRTTMTKGIWIYGPTGTGKSHKAFENFHPDTHFVADDDVYKKGWWDNYKGHKIVIFNDFRGEIPYNRLLNFVDKYPLTVPRRGRSPLPFLAETLIITSSLHPASVYKNRDSEDSLEQLLRRFQIIHLENKAV